MRIPKETQDKINFLVDTINTEVAWFGSAEVEVSPHGNTIYTLKPELLIYPQLVTASTVSPDDEGEAYDQWWIEQLSSGRVMTWHGHSHCNMGCFPSGTDQSLRTNLNADGGIHIYTIHNKSGAVHLEVYVDNILASSILIDNDDDFKHEDILIQLNKVKHAPAVTSLVTPRRYNTYQDDSWWDRYETYSEKPEVHIAKAEAEIVPIETSAEISPDIALAELIAEETLMEADIPLWLIDDLEQEVADYAAILINNYRTELLTKECPVCGDILNEEGECEFCKAAALFDQEESMPAAQSN